jgi:hypothetical protein
MKTFNQFIGESREESRPVFNTILDRVDTPTKLSQYFEENLGADFLEFSRESEMGDKIAREFSPRGAVTQKKYRSFMGSKSGYPYYYFVTNPNGTTALAIRSTDWTTWWIGQDTLAEIDPSWLIDRLFADF